jgi:hypothetical protein
MGVTRIRVTVDRVTLRGGAPIDREALLIGLREQLSRTLLVDPAGRGGWGRSRQVPVLRLGAVNWPQGPGSGRRLGRELGNAVGKGLKR